MTAVEMLCALERGEAPEGGFHHADHLRVAWACLEECGAPEAALTRLAATLRRFAASLGQLEKYSDAVTGFWIYQLASVRALMPAADLETVRVASQHVSELPVLVDPGGGTAAVADEEQRGT